MDVPTIANLKQAHMHVSQDYPYEVLYVYQLIR